MQTFETFEAISTFFTVTSYLAAAAVTLWIGLEFRECRHTRQKPAAPRAKMPVISAGKIVCPKFRPARAA